MAHEVKPALPSEALSQHLAIVGRVGSGKTYAAKGLVEQLLADQRRVCILDPTGAWYGLRSSADGKHAGFPVAVFGGDHADVAIGEQSGAALAKVIAEKNLPSIVDLSEMLIGQRHRFVSDFAQALYQHNRAPLHLIIDEADEFCPQNPMPETKRMLHHVDRIVRRGRIRGFRVMLITQRPAVLHKNVLTQANALIAMRLTAPQDRKAILAWVEGQADTAQAKAVMDTLAGLQTGEGWVWAPEQGVLERVTFPRIKTFDSSRTPGNDDAVLAPTKLAAVDLDDIKASFDAVEQESKTLAALKADNQKLTADLACARRELEKAKKVPAQPVKHAAASELDLHNLAPLRTTLAQIAKEFNKALAACDDLAKLQVNPVSFTVHQPARAAATQSPRPIVAPAERLPAGERALLTAIAQARAGATRAQLTVLTGCKQSTRNAYIQRLRAKGFVELVGERLLATSEGTAALGPGFEPLPTGEALREHWLQRLPEGESKIFRSVCDAWPEPKPRDALGEVFGLAASTRNAYIQRLAARQLVTADRTGVLAAAILFDRQ